MAKRKTLAYYRNRIPVDRHKLDTELPRHAELLGEVMREATFRKYEAEAAKDELDRIEAVQLLSLKRQKDDGSLKANVDELKAMITASKRVQRQKAVVREALKDAAAWQAMSDSYRHRGYALRELTELLIHEHMSDPGEIATGRSRRRTERKTESKNRN